jgi:hypothetical protein
MHLFSNFYVLVFKWIVIHLNSSWACTREGTHACLFSAQPSH